MMRKLFAAFLFICLMLLIPAAVYAEDITVTVTEDGGYYLRLRYTAVPGNREIQYSAAVNGETGVFVFNRSYADANKDYKTQSGNQTFPSQIEITRSTECFLTDSLSFTRLPRVFQLKAGGNTVSFEALSGEISIEGLTAEAAAPLNPYEEYKNQNINASKPSQGLIKIQAEDAAFKSSPALFPINDRTDPLLEPYHPSNIVLNAIGGTAWGVSGQLIEWEADVPESGLYRLLFKYTERDKRGFVSRALYINGRVPFAEAAGLRFPYNAGFEADFLSDPATGEEYWFYLNAGKNIIGLEATLGSFGQVVEDATKALQELSAIYQDIIMVTSASPDKYRDYQILNAIPDLRNELRAQSAGLGVLLGDIQAVAGNYAESNAIIERLRLNIDKIAARPDRIAVYLVDFKASISSLSSFITSAQTQPLILDYVCVAGADAGAPRAKANFFESVWHNIRSFIGSFTNDYNSNSAGQAAAAKDIVVWLSTGRDTYNVIQRLINESFVPNNPDISVNFNLVNGDIIFPASLTGNGPDVVLQTLPSTPINFGYRGGAVDLTQFPDFPEVASRFAPAAIETLSFDGAVYALPDQMTFNVLFYRKDVFERLSLPVPSSMKDFLSIVPTLQKNYMEIYFTTLPQATLGTGSSISSTGMSIGASTRPLNPVYASILYQMGGQLYGDNGAWSDITSDIAVDAFKYWTELYTKHNFIVETDFVTRFRVGEVPVGVYDLWQYNTLNVSAPEIKGNWDIAPIPGLIDEDGNLRRENPISVDGSMIVKNIAEKNDTVDESWRFLKWFTSEDVQYRLAMEIEAIWGDEWRYQTANLAAFERLGWGAETLATLMESIDSLVAIPQVPGGYITGRVVNNAFLSVVTETTNSNPTDAIFIARDQINDELRAKRKEFGIE